LSLLNVLVIINIGVEILYSIFLHQI